jgi:dCMP deaminase
MSDPLAPGWATEQLRRAYAVALGSPDTSTQNGAIVFDRDGMLIGQGCNSFTAGTTVTAELLERPKKYAFIEHAERNAIYSATRVGIPPATMVCAWAACADCARAIVQAGITSLIRHVREDTTGRWGESIEWGDEILRAAGVDIINVTDELGGCVPILFSGQEFHP